MSRGRIKLLFFRMSSLAVLGAVFFTGLGIGYLSKTASSFYMRSKSFSGRYHQASDADTLHSTLREKFQTYEQLIGAYSLSHGMVVVKERGGEIRHQCDSLLFSSLRYVALHKQGELAKATEAWKAITLSYIDGRWRRHPLCQDQAVSRDMVLGLLIALSVDPPGGKDILIKLIEQIRGGVGFFDEGPFYVSYVTPQIAELIRLLAYIYEIPQSSLPFLVRYGFSTLDINSTEIRRGYQSHLLALGLWLELELIQQSLSRENFDQSMLSRSMLAFVMGTNAEVTADNPYLWHWEFIAEKLYRVDEQNLFYKYLYLRSRRELNFDTALDLAHDLVNMPVFPNGFLPMDCDRRADYLWQRDSQEAKVKRPSCRLIYPGVDFQWMAALILENIDQKD